MGRRDSMDTSIITFLQTIQSGYIIFSILYDMSNMMIFSLFNCFFLYIFVALLLFEIEGMSQLYKPHFLSTWNYMLYYVYNKESGQTFVKYLKLVLSHFGTCRCSTCWNQCCPQTFVAIQETLAWMEHLVSSLFFRSPRMPIVFKCLCQSVRRKISRGNNFQ